MTRQRSAGPRPKLLSEASVYLAGAVGTGLVSLVAVTGYSRILGPADYGMYALILAITGALSGLLALGGDVVLARFWFDGGSMADRRAFAFTWILFIFLWSSGLVALACAAVAWGGDVLGVEADVLPMTVVALWVMVPTLTAQLCAQLLRNSFRPLAYAVATVLPPAIGAALGLSVALRLGIWGPVVGLAATAIAGVCVAGVLARDCLSPGFDRHLVPPAVRLGAPLVPASVAFWVFGGLDRVVIARFEDAQALGSYALAAQLVAPLTLLMSAIAQAWLPRMLRRSELGEPGAVDTIYHAFLVAVAAYGAIAVGISVLAPHLLLVIGGEPYLAGVGALPFLAVGASFLGASLFPSTASTVVKKTAMAPLIAVGAAVVDIGMLYVLVPRLGVAGAGVAVMGANLALMLGNLSYGLHVNPGTFSPRSLLGMLMVVIAAASLCALSPASAVSWVGSVCALAILALMSRPYLTHMRADSHVRP